MKYLSVDLETTGLDHKKHSIIELAAILAATPDRENPEGRILGTFRAHIFPENMVWDAYCLGLHSSWISWIREIPREKWAENLIYSDMVQASGAFTAWRESVGLNKSVNVAGKNFGTFDSRFLDAYGHWWRRRIIDVGTMYRRPDDEVLPDLETCKRRTVGVFDGDYNVKHDALSDAMDVVKLVNYAWSLP